jgi:hypothetical protein
VAAIDLSALARDGSFPAFRLPFQDLMENNHRPFWAEDALMPPPTPDMGGGGCLPQGADCTSGRPCCPPLICVPNGMDKYVCEKPIG